MKKTAAAMALAGTVLFTGIGLGTGHGVKADTQEKIARVWLIGGQSNAHGISKASEIEAPEPDERVKIYRPQSDDFASVTVGYGYDETRFGPEVGMAQKLIESMPDEEHFILKYAWGDTDLYADWRSPSMGGEIGIRYQEFVRTVKDGLSAIAELGYTADICGMAWMQGERDAMLKVRADAYAENLVSLICDFRNEFQAEFPFCIGKINEDFNLMPEHRTVIRAQQAVANAMEKVYFVDTSDLAVMPSDPWHYNGESMLKLGNKFATVLTRIKL